MQIKTEKSLLFWFVFFSLLSGALIFQSSLLSSGEKYSFVPYLTLPPLVFVFLYHDGFSSLYLLLFMSFLSSAFSPLPVSSLFLIYFLYFLLVFFIKNFFFKSSFLFFILVFTFSFVFPYLFDLTYNFSIKDFSFSTSLFYFFKAIMTLILSFLLFPFLKKYFQENTRF